MHGPAAVTRTAVPALGGDENVIGRAAVGRQGFGHELLAVTVLLHAERIGVRGVDDGDAGVERGVNGGDRLATVRPSLNGQWHFAQSDGTDGPVADGTLQ